jgi:CelD/BcsL family acetyltransferase involved in cellulose biosynthesis
MERTLNIQWLDGDTALAEIKNQWQALEQDATTSIFTSWDWLDTWWKHYGQEKSLHILLVEIDNNLEFILPFQVTRQYILGIVPIAHWYNLGSKSSAGCDYLGGIFSPSLELSTQELEKIFVAVRQKRNCLAILHLHEIGEFAFPQKDELNQLIQNYRHIIQKEPTYCPTSHLPDSWDDFLNSLSRNFRSQIRRDIKKFESSNELTISVHKSPEEIQGKVTELKRLNTQRITQLGKTSSFKSKHLTTFLDEATKRLASQQHCTFYQLHHNKKSIAIILLINDNHTQYYYLGGFDEEYKKYSPINLLFVYAIQDAIANGYKEFNLLKGKEPYKYRWLATNDINNNIVVIDGGILQLALYHTERFLFRATRKIKHWRKQHLS